MTPPDVAAADPVGEYVQRLLDAAPPFTDEQRTRLAVLLGGPGECAPSQRAA